MRWLFALAAVLVFVSGSAALAADELRYGPAGRWVKAAPIPAAKPDATGAYEFLLVNRQVEVGARGAESYVETAVKILTVQGLQEFGTLNLGWNPASEAVTVNKAVLLRDGQAIDLLADGARFTTLRRETRLDQSVLDGQLTAVLELKGLRVGDIVNLATSSTYSSSILPDHFEAVAAHYHSGKIGRVIYRHAWPKTKAVRWRATSAFGEVTQSEADGKIEILYDAVDMAAAKAPENAPPRFNVLGRLDLSDFKDWKEVSRLVAPLFERAAQLRPDSPLKTEATKIKAAHETPEARALAALKLVESEVRYVALVMGVGGYTPADADATWQSRYGDCKAKSVLLMALLRELGFKAEPALVDSDGGDGLDERLPMLGVFDHVVVRAEIAGRTYWLDGTRVGDRSLASPSGTPFVWALPLTLAGGALEQPLRPPPTVPLVDWALELDASAGVDAKGPGSMRITYRGELAREWEAWSAGREPADVRKALAERFDSLIAWLEVETTTFGWDESAEGYQVAFNGRGKLDWTRDGAVRATSLESSVSKQFDLSKRAAGEETPYVVEYPTYWRDVSRIRLPKRGQGFETVGGDVDLVVGGKAINRVTKIVDGEVVVTTTFKSIAPEVSPKDAAAFEKALQTSPVARDVFVRTARVGVSATSSAQIEDLLRLAQQNEEAGESAEALTYVERALRLDPRNKQGLALRVLLRVKADDHEGALKDYRTLKKIASLPDGDRYEAGMLLSLGRAREALALLERSTSDDDATVGMKVMALAGLGRGREMAAAMDTMGDFWRPEFRSFAPSLYATIESLEPRVKNALVRELADEPQSPSARVVYSAILAETDQKAALAQLAQALLIRPGFTLALWQRANIHYDLKQYPQAAADYDILVKGTPEDTSLLNRACWSRAVGDIELDVALRQCDKALSLKPELAGILDSRGLVNYRLGRLEEAIADYDQAIANGEDDAHSLFGRGLVKHRKGDKAGGDADFAQAAKLQPDVAKTYAGYGIAIDAR